MASGLLTRTVKKSIHALALISGASALIPAYCHAQDLAAIKQAAAKEGKLVFWASTPAQETADALLALFNKRFNLNIKMERVALSAKDVTPRLLAENQAGKFTADVAIVSDSMMPTLMQNGVVEKVDWEGNYGTIVDAKLLASAVNTLVPEFKGYGLEFRHLVYGIAYNTTMVNAQTAPKKWEDLAAPAWRRKVTIDASLDPLVNLAPILGKEQVVALAQRIIDNSPVYANGTRNAVQKIVAGEASIGALAVNTVMEEQQKGSPIAFVIPEPQAVIPQQVVFVAKNAPNPNVAKLWTAWFGSEGMDSKPIIDEGSLRARAGAPGDFGEYFAKNNLPTRTAKSVEELNTALDMAKTLDELARARRR